jgi:hypothetical protein
VRRMASLSGFRSPLALCLPTRFPFPPAVCCHPPYRQVLHHLPFASFSSSRAPSPSLRSTVVHAGGRGVPHCRPSFFFLSLSFALLSRSAARSFVSSPRSSSGPKKEGGGGSAPLPSLLDPHRVRARIERVCVCRVSCSSLVFFFFRLPLPLHQSFSRSLALFLASSPAALRHSAGAAKG